MQFAKYDRICNTELQGKEIMQSNGDEFLLIGIQTLYSKSCVVGLKSFSSFDSYLFRFSHNQIHHGIWIIQILC